MSPIDSMWRMGGLCMSNILMNANGVIKLGLFYRTAEWKRQPTDLTQRMSATPSSIRQPTIRTTSKIR